MDSAHDDGRPTPRIRVGVYLVRGEGENTQVLVFDQVDHPEAGTQVPGGGVDPGESLDSAARREVLEETGLVIDGPLRALAADHMLIDFAPGEQVSVFFEARTDESRNGWDHVVTGGSGTPGPGDDVGLLFRCSFVPLSWAITAADSYHFRYTPLITRGGPELAGVSPTGG